METVQPCGKLLINGIWHKAGDQYPTGSVIQASIEAVVEEVIEDE